MKKSPLIIITALLTLTGASCSFFTDELTKTIGDITISFPKDLSVLDVPSTTGLYENIKIVDPENPLGAAIEMSVPKADQADNEAIDGVPPDALDVVTETITLGARTGTRTSYRIARQIENGAEESFRVIVERYESEYENAPVEIRQTIPTGADEMVAAWEKIRNSLADEFSESGI